MKECYQCLCKRTCVAMQNYEIFADKNNYDVIQTQTFLVMCYFMDKADRMYVMGDVL